MFNLESIKKEENYFYSLSDKLFSLLKNDESLTVIYGGENTQFYRYNESKLRQSTTVSQYYCNLVFIKDNRLISKSLNLTFNENIDFNLSSKLINESRENAKNLPESRGVVLPQSGECSSQIIESASVDNIDVNKEILSNLSDVDMAGIFVSGPVSKGVSNSKGLKHWFTSNSFYFDYSLYSAKQKAVKSCYAGSAWDSEKFNANISVAKKLLAKMDLPAVEVKPGKHRAYLAPGAVNEIVGMLSWGALSMSAYKQGYCPLAKLKDGKEFLSDKFSLQENFELGLAPKFNSIGEVSANKVNLIDCGKLNNFLISSKTANEFNEVSNHAEEHEHLRSPAIKPGSLSEADVLEKLGTGLYLSNLHYLNWSDRMSARITGMTRFACFWVENGEIVGPIKDLRFDESLFNCFGSKVIDFTDTSSVSPNVMTYSKRHIGGTSVPGLLLNEFNFTL